MAIALFIGTQVNGQTKTKQDQVVNQPVNAKTSDNDSVKVLVKTNTKNGDRTNVQVLVDSLVQAFTVNVDSLDDKVFKMIKIMNGDSVITKCWNDSLANVWLNKLENDTLFQFLPNRDKTLKILSDSLKQITVDLNFDSLFDPLKYNDMPMEWIGNLEDMDSLTQKHIQMNPDKLNKHLIFVSDDGEEVCIEKNGELVFINKNESIDTMDSRIEVTTNDKGQKVVVLQTRIVLDDLSADELTELNAQGIKTSKKEPEFDYIKFYPNPSSDAISIQFKMTKPEDTEVRICNMLGQEVFHDSMKNFSGDYNKTINLKEKGKGSYIMQISQGKRITTRKIIVE
jgi:hypothetical protein